MGIHFRGLEWICINKNMDNLWTTLYQPTGCACDRSIVILPTRACSIQTTCVKIYDYYIMYDVRALPVCSNKPRNITTTICAWFHEGPRVMLTERSCAWTQWNQVLLLKTLRCNYHPLIYATHMAVINLKSTNRIMNNVKLYLNTWYILNMY